MDRLTVFRVPYPDVIFNMVNTTTNQSVDPATMTVMAFRCALQRAARRCAWPCSSLARAACAGTMDWASVQRPELLGKRFPVQTGGQMSMHGWHACSSLEVTHWFK